MRLEHFVHGSICDEEFPSGFCIGCGQPVWRIILGCLWGHWTVVLCEHRDAVCEIEIDEQDNPLTPPAMDRALVAIALRRQHAWWGAAHGCHRCGRPYGESDAILADDGHRYHRACSPFRLS